jgi:ABC-2 type transport system ATP-binding protein
MQSAISIEDVSKRFRLHHEKFTSLKERVIHFGRSSSEDYWALKDVGFEIAQGQTMGLLGHNGSGKSTLLKCIAGILQPTSGLIRSRGRMAAMLELGAGFHPDLTGRENVYLNASLLGLPKKFVDDKFDEIVAFAELEQFIDNQVKFYSSGMYVRLGFAVAVNMEPEILLVDEVLAVGDELFQRKCLDRVKQFQREGRTIVVVSHSVEMVRQVCDRAAVLHQGELVSLGEPGEAIRSYREHLLARQAKLDAEHEAWLAASIEPEPLTEAEQIEALPYGEKQERKSTRILSMTNVALEYPNSDTVSYLRPGDPLSIRVDYETTQPVSDVSIGIAIHDRDDRVVYGVNTEQLGVDLGVLNGTGSIQFEVEHVPLLDGDFPVTVGAHSVDGAVVYDWHDQRYRFSVMNPTKAEGIVNMPFSVKVTSPA